MLVVRVIVNVSPPIMPAGLKVAVAFAGNPVTLGVTVPLNPFNGVMAKAELAEPPVKTLGEPGRVTLNACRLSVAVALCVREPLVPLIVRVKFPARFERLVIIVRVELPPATIDVGLKVAVFLTGSPVKASVTVPVNPFSGATVTV